MLLPSLLLRLCDGQISQAQRASHHGCFLDGALLPRHVLLVKVGFDRHLASVTLMEVRLLCTLCKLVLSVGADFDNLSAPSAISQHHAVKHIVQIHLIRVDELRLGDTAELTCILTAVVVIHRS